MIPGLTWDHIHAQPNLRTISESRLRSLMGMLTFYSNISINDSFLRTSRDPPSAELFLL